MSPLTARELVAVQHAEVRKPQRQLPVRPCARAEDEAMPRAVHRLQAELLLLYVQQEHVFLHVTFHNCCLQTVRTTVPAASIRRYLLHCLQQFHSSSRQQPKQVDTTAGVSTL